MPSQRFIREEALLGPEAMTRLSGSHVAVFGLGGVGSWASEALVRGGVGTLTLVDFDTVGESNLNRQLIALHSTIGRPKVEVMKERIYDICPGTKVEAIYAFYKPGESLNFSFSD